MEEQWNPADQAEGDSLPEEEAEGLGASDTDPEDEDHIHVEWAGYI